MLPAVLTLFVIYFFRNPSREMLGEPGVFLSPADGKVIGIQQVYEDRFIDAECIQIRIFLNIFNVHINRIPIKAEVAYIQRQGLLFKPAYRPDSGKLNVRNYVGLESDYGKVLLVQITGIIARRIVCWIKPGDQLEAGERFGLIRFGSCTEIYLPVDCEVEIQIGDRVRGGETIIGRNVGENVC